MILTDITHMRLRRVLVSLVALLVSLSALSAPLYKCEINGVLAFQDTPCPPAKTKQKIACADVDGFAVYQDSLNEACANAPAGTAKKHDFLNTKAQKLAAETSPSRTVVKKNKPNKTVKEVIVRGYTKEDGTKVPSYTRSLPGEKRKE